MTGYNFALSLGLTNRDSDDYGVLASATNVRKYIRYNHYCTSSKCANPKNPWKKVLVLQSTTQIDKCPKCGHTVFVKRTEEYPHEHQQ